MVLMFNWGGMTIIHLIFFTSGHISDLSANWYLCPLTVIVELKLILARDRRKVAFGIEEMEQNMNLQNICEAYSLCPHRRRPHRSWNLQRYSVPGMWHVCSPAFLRHILYSTWVMLLAAGQIFEEIRSFSCFPAAMVAPPNLLPPSLAPCKYWLRK